MFCIWFLIKSQFYYDLLLRWAWASCFPYRFVWVGYQVCTSSTLIWKLGTFLIEHLTVYLFQEREFNTNIALKVSYVNKIVRTANTTLRWGSNIINGGYCIHTTIVVTLALYLKCAYTNTLYCHYFKYPIYNSHFIEHSCCTGVIKSNKAQPKRALW